MQWDDFDEMQEGRVVDVMAEMKCGMGNKKKVKKGKKSSGDENPWVTPDEAEHSEPEKVGFWDTLVGSWDTLAETSKVMVREEWERMVEKERREGGILDMFIENMAVMEESHRKEAMRNCEKAMLAEWRSCTEGFWVAIEKRVEEERKAELMKEGVRRMYFQEGGGPDCVFNFGKYEGKIFAAVYLKDQSYVEWAVKQDRCRTWKLKAFQYFILRLRDLERVMKREKELEEMKRVARTECLVEEMAQEEMKIVEKHRVRWADMNEELEMERVAVEEREEQREMARCGELEMAEERKGRGDVEPVGIKVEEREREDKAVSDGEMAEMKAEKREWEGKAVQEWELGGDEGTRTWETLGGESSG